MCFGILDPHRMKKPYFLDLKRFLWNEGVRSAPEISRNIFPPGMFTTPALDVLYRSSLIVYYRNWAMCSRGDILLVSLHSA